MPAVIVVDSGPLVALFDADDQNHELAVRWLKGVRERLVTTLAVVTEVAFLLDFSVATQAEFVRWVSQGGCALVDMDADDLMRTADIMEKYHDLPADFADASLIAICERVGTRDIATFDRDFEVYRYRNRQRFRNLLSYK
jgi:predicted nucleic acid-binding protein